MALDPNKLKEAELRLNALYGQGVSAQADTSRQAQSALGDTYRSLATGVQRLPGIATGIADIGAGLYGGAVRSVAQMGGASEETIGKIDSTFDRPFDRATDWVGEKTGLQPSEWAERGAERYSPMMQAAQAATQQATQENITDRWEAGDKWGAVRGIAPTALSYIQNPRSIQALVGESLPMTFAGGAAGAGIRAAAGTKASHTLAGGLAGPIGPQVPRLGAAGAAGIGEGLVIAGVVMDEIDNEADYVRAALASLGAGVFGGAIGAGGAALSRSMGLIDIDAAIAGKSLGIGGATARSWPVRIAGGAVMEGLQEVPQESMEQVMTNWAEGNPLFDGVLETVAPAFLAGAAMGGGVNILSPSRRGEFNIDDQRLFDPTLQPDKGTPGAPTTLAEFDPDQLIEGYKTYALVAREGRNDPETAERALGMMEQIKAELDTRGVSEAALSLEVAQKRFGELTMQIPMVRRKYNEALEADPAKARKLLGSYQNLLGEYRQIYGQYGRQATQGETQVIGRYMRKQFGDETASKQLFKPDGTLRKNVADAITEAKALSEQELAVRVAKVGSAVTTPKQMAEATIAEIRGITGERLAELTAEATLVSNQGKPKAKREAVDARAAQNAEIKRMDAKIDDALTTGRNVGGQVMTPELAAQMKAAVRERVGRPASEAKPVVKKDTPTDLTAAAAPTPAPTAQAQTPTPVAAQETPVGEQTVAQTAQARPTAQTVGAAVQTQQPTAPVTGEQRNTPPDTVGYTVEADPATGRRVFRSAAPTQTQPAAQNVPTQADPAVAQTGEQVEAAQTQPTPATPEVEGVLAQFRLLAGEDAMQSLPRVQSQDMQTFLDVLQDMDAAATVDNVIAEVARRTQTEGKKPRAPKTVRTNIQTAMRKLRVAAGLDPDTAPAVQDIVGAYLTQADASSAIFDETALQRDATQLAEEATNDTSEQALESRDIPEGFSVGTAGQAGTGISTSSEQLTNARENVKRLQNDLTTLRRRLGAEPQNQEQIVERMVATQERLREEQTMLADLEQTIQGEQEIEAIDNALRAQEFEQEVQALAARETYEVLQVILTEFDSPRGREAGQVWDQQVRPQLTDGPSWAEIANTDTQVAGIWLQFYALAQTGQLPPNMTVASVVRDVMKAHADPEGRKPMARAREIVANPPPEVNRGQVTRDVQRYVHRPTGTRTQGVQQAGPVAGAEQVAQDQAPRQEEVTPDAQTLRENAGRAAQPRRTVQKGQADRRSNVQQNAQAQREASDAQEQVKPVKKDKVSNKYLSKAHVFHAVRNDADIAGIVTNGLRRGTNLSVDRQGQAFSGEGDTILVFRRKDVGAQEKGYQNDALATSQAKPVAILKDTSLARDPAADKKLEERYLNLGPRYERFEAAATKLAAAMGMTVDQMEQKVLAGEKLPQADARVKELFAERDNIFKQMDFIEGERSRNENRQPVDEVIAPLTQFGLPVFTVEITYNDKTDKQSVKTLAEYAPAEPTETELSDRIDQVRELAGQLNSQTRKRYDTMVMQIVGDKKLGLREKLTAYDDLIARLTNAVRGQEANRAGADAFAAQQAAAQETTPGLTPETNAQLDQHAAGTDTDTRWYTLDGAAQDYLTGATANADVFLAHAEAKGLIEAEGYLDNLEAIDAALTDLADAIFRAQTGQTDAQPGIVPRVAAQGMSIEAVYAQIRQEFGDLPGVASNITVFQTLDGLPDAVVELLKKQLAKRNRVRGVFYDNHVYLHAPSLRNNLSVRGIVMHELGVHFALTGRTPQRMENLAAEVVNWYRSAMTKDELDWTQEERLAVVAVQAVEKASKGGPQAIDELVAYFVDAAVQMGINPTNLGNVPKGPLRQWFDTLMKTINEAIAKIDSFFAGTSDVAVTAQDVVDLVFGMAQRELYDPKPRTLAAPAPKPGVDALIQQMPKSTQWWWKDLQGKLLKAAGVTSFSREIVDWVKRHGLTAAKPYFDMLTGKIAIRSGYLTQIQHVVAPTKKWDRKHRKAFNDFLYLSAYREEWGFEPTWLKKHNYNPNSDVAKAFEKMVASFPANQRETARRTAIAMFQHSHTMHSTLQKHIRGEIETSYARLIAGAKTPTQRKHQEAERDAALRDHDTKQQGFRNAYLPLRRWGEWAVVYKSPQLREAEAAGDRTRVRQLKGDFKHYVVLFEENERTALRTRETFQELLRRETGDSTIEFPEPYPRERQREMLNEEIPFDMINKLKQQVDLGPDVAKGVKDKIMNALDRMYITALAESSSRKSELERMSVRGANPDMLRAFIEQGTGIAALSAALDTNASTRELIQQMKEQAHKAGPGRRERMLALNELLSRHAQALEYQDHPAIAQIMGTTSVWMLMSNPAYYIQNATQPFMLTYPMLAGEFGGAKAMAKMVQAYPRILKLYRATKDGSLLDPKLLDSIENDPSLKQLFEDLQMRGLLDVGIAMDLGTFKDAKTRAGRTVNAVHTKMVGAVRTVELFNRGVTAMVAYEMKLAQLRKANPQVALEKHQADAREFASDTVAVTQGDYSGVNAPRLISMIPAGKLVTQFRKFQLIQIGLLTRVMYQAFKGANPAERKLARAQFGYLMMMHGTVGGMLGLPIPMVMWWAVAHVFGDEDEPADIEMLLRREIGNKEVADLLLRGLPAYMGVNASERLGMGMTFSLLPFTDIKPTRDGAMVAMAAMLGPWTTALARGADGIGQMQNGNTLAGVAQMMPAGVMNAIRAYEQHTVGVRNRRGDVLLAPEELGYLELVTQGLGWPNKTLTDRHLVAGMKFKAEEQFKNRAARIRKAYADAFRDGDSSTMNRAMDEWVRLQEMKLRYGLGNFLPLKDLTSAPLERMEREMQTVGGVQYESTTQGFVEDMFM